VTYAGVWSNDWNLEYDLLRRVYSRSGELPFDLPPYVFAHFRQGLWTAVNYTDKPVTLPVPQTGPGSSSAKPELPPAGVVVWKE
jgi:beta-galactosidase